QFYDPGKNWNYGIKTNTFESLEFKVHASSGILTLNTEEVSDSLKVEVYNLLGQQVLQGNVDYRVSNIFNIEGPKGYYLVKLSSNTKSKAVKVYIP
ncbi:MAG: T9SS type A sorting domain-containing protein, partial [Methylomarinum sp.]|nr:T9SS type A sorting domain-containing protein [Methylomarinum sp.]